MEAAETVIFVGIVFVGTLLGLSLMVLIYGALQLAKDIWRNS